MAGTATAASGRLLLLAWLAGLGLLLACFLSEDPEVRRPVPASVDPTASDLGSVTAEARTRQQVLEGLGLPAWHQLGFRGRGVKVAILDSGFRGYRRFLGTGLPSSVRARSFRVDRDIEARDSQHGILCAEVVHALAPDADLLFASWEPDDPHAFLDAVHWARAEGARVVSCSLIMPGWSDGEGGGEIHKALAKLLGAGNTEHDAVCFASAGNIALRHWSGAFRPDAQGRHQWVPDQPRNTLTPWGRDRVAVELYGPTHTAFELQVFKSAGGALVGSARAGADSWQRGQAIVRFEPAANATYGICLRGPTQAATAENFHLVVLGGNLEHATAHGSIAFPGDGAEVYAVGAVDQAGQRLGYSSCGPNSPRPKPDFVAVVPFPSVCRDHPFAGTSAAAPQAAGLAAVLLSRHPEWAPTQVFDALREAAEDLGPPGHDHETGYGALRLPK